MSTRLTITLTGLVDATSMAFWLRSIVESSIRTAPAWSTRTPVVADAHGGPALRPLTSSPRRMTSSLTPALMVRPLPTLNRTPPITLRASLVIAFVIVTAPSPAESIALISPDAAVLLIAPANVLHGAVREHSYESRRPCA